MTLQLVMQGEVTQCSKGGSGGFPDVEQCIFGETRIITALRFTARELTVKLLSGA